MKIPDDQITTLAREYAELTDGSPADITYIKSIAENAFRFLLRRFCLVEKNKVATKHKEVLVALESNDNEDVKWGTYRLSLLKSLFPVITNGMENGNGITEED